MKRIPLRNRAGETVAHALVDDEDYAWLTKWRWSYNKSGYASRGTCRGTRPNLVQRSYAMHREILGLKRGDGRQADHKNRNKLDNQRSNLRVATHAQNKQNLDSYRGSTSKHRGVSLNRARGVWVARGRLNGIVHALGEYATEREAAAVAAEWRRQHMPFSEEAAK